MELLSEGQVIRGTYEVELLLGEGAFGKVYRVRHKFLGLQSMKVFKAAGMTAAEIEGLLSEAVLLSKLNHPNIIRVFDADIAEGPGGMFGYFTMEYVAGGSLDRYWQSHGDKLMPVETAVDVARQICRGLVVAHGQDPPIVHRDIKPQNVLVGYDAEGLRARVSDFGLAKRANPMTQHLSAKGTPWFKPPEVFRGPRADMDSRAGDVWAVGSTLYLMLTDRLPFDSIRGAGADVFDPRRFDEDLIPAKSHNSTVNAALERILVRALAKSPDDRHPTARELLDELEAWRPGGDGSRAGRSAAPADIGKGALGAHRGADEGQARRLVASAMSAARNPGGLAEASDLLEAAINAWPPLGQEYAYRLKLWRRGIMM